MDEERVSDPWSTTTALPLGRRSCTPRSRRRNTITASEFGPRPSTTPQTCSSPSARSSSGPNRRSLGEVATNALLVSKLRRSTLTPTDLVSSTASKPLSRLPSRPVSQLSQVHPDRICRETNSDLRSVPHRRRLVDDPAASNVFHRFQNEGEGEQPQNTSGQDENGEPCTPRSSTPRSSMPSRAKKSSAELDHEFQRVFENLAPAPEKPEMKRSTVRKRQSNVEAVYFDLLTLENQAVMLKQDVLRKDPPNHLKGS